MYVHNWYHSNVSSIHLYTWTQFTIHMAQSPCFFSPLADSPLSPLAPLSTPFYLLGTLLAVTGSVCLGLRLLVNWPPLSQPLPQTPPPLQIPRTLVTQCLTKTTSGTIRRLLSGTASFKSTLKNIFRRLLNYLQFFLYNNKNRLIFIKIWGLIIRQNHNDANLAESETNQLILL